MKRIKSMSQVELAAYIQDALQANRIEVVLSGGSASRFTAVTNTFQKIWT